MIARDSFVGIIDSLGSFTFGRKVEFVYSATPNSENKQVIHVIGKFLYDRVASAEFEMLIIVSVANEEIEPGWVEDNKIHVRMATVTVGMKAKSYFFDGYQWTK